MSIHEQHNLTRFAADLGVCQDREGRDVAVGIVKATFRFDRSGSVEPAAADEQVPVFTADRHHGDPERTSLRYASDVIPVRRGTDVVVVGHAYGHGRTTVGAGFRIGPLRKLLLVHGPRVWVTGMGGRIAGPVAFDKVPVRYELAYGGSHDEPGVGTTRHPENPVGIGFARGLGDRAPLPQIEYEDSRFTSPGKPVRPAGLGFIPTGWRQRSRFAGTFDASWRETRSPLLPADADDRFHDAVPMDQVLPQKLVGRERIQLVNLHPRYESLVLGLPALSFRASFRVRGRLEEIPMVADTLLVEPDLERLAISYRASLPMGPDLLRLQGVTFRQVEGASAR